MIKVLLLLFFISLFLIVYSYLLYPSLIEVLAFIFCRRKQNKTSNKSLTYSVSIVMAVHNEEKVLPAKLKSLIELDFVAREAHNQYANIEVLIGSDASTDNTDQIIEDFSKYYPFIRLIRFRERSGKAPIINQLVDMASGEIIVSTDANVIFDRRLLDELLLPFHDPKVGMVAANIIRGIESSSGMQKIEKKYIIRENKIKKMQSCLSGLLIGVEGGCYAIRKSLFAKVPQGYFMDDFFITMSVIQKGYNISFAENALCYEDVMDDRIEEFKRKTRISIGNYQNMVHYWRMLFNPLHRVFFHFISHKFIRWMTPFLMILALICGWVLSFYDGVYLYPSLLLTCLMVLPLAGELAYSIPILSYATHFVYMNYALLRGFFLYLRRPTSSVWQPTARKTLNLDDEQDKARVKTVRGRL
jgi:cellulose synthase/poly-beta-1,6-N-acetylglucosamine synthase-like glycosyltransferase